MESFDEDEGDLLFPAAAAAEDPASPLPRPKLKRLKKASQSRATAPDRSPSSQTLEIPDPSHAAIPEEGAPDLGLSEENDGLDPLFPEPGFRGEGEEEEEGGGFDSFDPDVDSGGIGTGGLIEELRRESAKKRLIWDDVEETMETKKDKKTKTMKKKKSDKNHADFSTRRPKESVCEKRRLEKERKAYLDLMHAESQRLLRETRDVSFKSVTLVQKPISSVLEKIRLRKLEITKHVGFRYCTPNLTDSVAEADCSLDETAPCPELPADLNLTNDNSSNMILDDAALDAGNTNIIIERCEDVAADKESGENNHSNDSANDVAEESPSSPMPSSPIPDDDVSSSEASDKENIDPHLHKAVSMDPYPKGGPAKAYLDEEAEEEDDSDHDLTRFQENEEDDDDDSDENEVLNDLIATGFEERPADHEKRNELHQKWLEQQDAAETNNVLQRLKCNQKQKESTIKDEDDDEDLAVESADERSYEPLPKNVIRQNSERAKQMIAQMFTDDHDIYVPSDDEEIEQSLVRQRLSKQTDSSFTSPLDDEQSKEIFGLIKKLNIAPQPKKRGRQATSNLDMLMLGGNSNSSSKSSFVGRTTNSSVSSSHKSATFRAFIFGRDDSNSRSDLSSSESHSMGQAENKQSRPPSSTKFSNSQSKSASFRAKSEANATVTSSLYEILRRSSVNFDKEGHVITETQANHQFSAFRSIRRIS
uniref:Uncharacterized protein n=1 Tax=Ananas comosus var. bracteatus TaxID=296719 RepID=A0A6V7NLE9_ANACO|nr:unnamed protein product [Ananas comosus var. bracteatus]